MFLAPASFRRRVIIPLLTVVVVDDESFTPKRHALLPPPPLVDSRCLWVDIFSGAFAPSRDIVAAPASLLCVEPRRRQVGELTAEIVVGGAAPYSQRARFDHRR